MACIIFRKTLQLANLTSHATQGPFLDLTSAPSGVRVTSSGVSRIFCLVGPECGGLGAVPPENFFEWAGSSR